MNRTDRRARNPFGRKTGLSFVIARGAIAVIAPLALVSCATLFPFRASSSTHPSFAPLPPPPAQSLQGAAKSQGESREGPALPATDLSGLVNPLAGTGSYPGVTDGDNNLFPGVVAPFGMFQWSPDTGNGRHRSGYSYADTAIADFSIDHLSGVGCTYGEDVAFMPFIGAVPRHAPPRRAEFSERFSHTSETAAPGYYAVTLDNGVAVELTANVRSGLARITYPSGADPALMIDVANDINGARRTATHISNDARNISGYSTGGHFCGTAEERTIYFWSSFDQNPTRWSTWSEKKLTVGGTDAQGSASGSYISFAAAEAAPTTVVVRVGVSYVSIANARENARTEIPDQEVNPDGFTSAASAARGRWDRMLEKIEISGGSADEKRTFYTMLYHALLGPVVVSDSNGEYIGYDGTVHHTVDGRKHYGVFSGWDVYRSECQLLAMIAPKEASDMAQSLVVDYRQGGTFPRWGVISEDSGVMMGDPAATMIADFSAFGATNFDRAAALTGLLRAATDPTLFAPRSKTYERDALADYRNLGYVPEHQRGGYGNVSMTLEYASADFALSRFAASLDDTNDSAIMLRQAANWRNLFNAVDGYFEMRRRDGSWAPGFRRDHESYNGDQAYVEGTAAQYLWMVPFDLNGLSALLGGGEAAAKRLDRFFAMLNAGDRGPDSVYAWVGNEPDLNTPWIYDFLGRPYRTEEIVREIITRLYSASPVAYPGNDDVGEMSSWYILAALGFYPELPGDDVLVFGSPLFPRAVLHLAGGDLAVVGDLSGPYVHALFVNGRRLDRPWIRFRDISRGGELRFELSDTPDIAWGSAPDASPPSYGSSP